MKNRESVPSQTGMNTKTVSPLILNMLKQVRILALRASPYSPWNRGESLAEIAIYQAAFGDQTAAKQSLRLSQPLAAESISVGYLLNTARAYHILGELREKRKALEAARRAAESNTFEAERVNALASTGAAYIQCGDFGGGESVVKRLITLNQSLEDRFTDVLCRLEVAQIHARRGNLPEALRTLTMAEKLINDPQYSDASTFDIFYADALARIGEAQAIAGQTQKARKTFTNALPKAEGRVHINIVGTLAMLGDTALARDTIAELMQAYRAKQRESGGNQDEPDGGTLGDVAYLKAVVGDTVGARSTAEAIDTQLDELRCDACLRAADATLRSGKPLPYRLGHRQVTRA
jgi:tetratricopeptide (TPR) repeat protein